MRITIKQYRPLEILENESRSNYACAGRIYIDQTNGFASGKFGRGEPKRMHFEEATSVRIT